MNGTTNENYYKKSHLVNLFIHTIQTQTFNYAEMWMTPKGRNKICLPENKNTVTLMGRL